ncbi:MAG TPA: uracil-DNA glycosylase, partial [Tistrella mobilis]|nr:uracil-DNA glycosylase [Tistrella mobilis]
MPPAIAAPLLMVPDPDCPLCPRLAAWRAERQ